MIDSGAMINSNGTLSNSSTVKAFSSYGNEYVLMTTTNVFYSFETTFNFTNIGKKLIILRNCCNYLFNYGSLPWKLIHYCRGNFQ